MSREKDPYIEKVLGLINSSLAGPEEFLINDEFEEPQLPIFFVIGAQRSGTTVLTQSLATLYSLSYPSNLIARFWRAPYLGAIISKSLNLNNESIGFDSKFGATLGVKGPHEFSYFWRHWFPESAALAKAWNMPPSHEKQFKKHLAAWQSVNEQPLLFKNLLEVVPNIVNLSKMFPPAIFLNIVREDLFVVQSTYECRKKYNGDYNSWFGIRPKNYKQIMEIEDPLIQCTEQVFHVKKDISDALSTLPDERYLTLKYEDFVSDTESVIDLLNSKFNLDPWNKEEKRIEDLKLKSGNKIRLDTADVQKVESHLETLSERHS